MSLLTVQCKAKEVNALQIILSKLNFTNFDSYMINNCKDRDIMYLLCIQMLTE